MISEQEARANYATATAAMLAAGQAERQVRMNIQSRESQRIVALRALYDAVDARAAAMIVLRALGIEPLFLDDQGRDRPQPPTLELG
jgi:hypothetical protein